MASTASASLRRPLRIADAQHDNDSNDIMGTKMKKSVAAAILSAVMFAAPLACAADNVAADADLQVMWKAVQADKKAYVASALNLTPAEAKKFWPIYDEYQRDLEMYNRRRNLALEGLIGSDKPVSDLYAKQLSSELIAADEGEIKARRKMQGKLIQAKLLSPLPAKKAALYLQIESRIRAVQFYGIAETFPLIK
jgi:Spy/CpxP family protein refolding chaperone